MENIKTPRAVKYYFGNDVYIEDRDPDLLFPNRSSWAIVVNGRCLNRVGEREIEPRPSSRNEAFFDRCRYSFAEAVGAAEAYLKTAPPEFGKILRENMQNVLVTDDLIIPLQPIRRMEGILHITNIEEINKP